MSDLSLSGPDTEADASVDRRILVAAKSLISRKGPIATTVRDISDASNTNVAAVNYYFGSKDALVRQILMDIIGPPNVRRKQMLHAAQERFEGHPMPLPVILDALMRPLVECERDGDGGRFFVRVEQHLRATPESEYTRFVADHFDGYAQVFFDAMRATLPHLSRGEIILRYEFVRGAALHALVNCDPQSNKIATLARGEPMLEADDNEAVLAMIVALSLNGFGAPSLKPSR